MFKKFFLLLIVAMLNVVAWGDPVLDITHNDELWNSSAGEYKVMVGYTKLKEPTVRVMDGTTDKTSLYNITYTTSTGNDGTGTDGVIDYDTRGVEIRRDEATRTTVEYLYGDVIMGSAGIVYVKVVATLKSDGVTTLTGYYKININATTPVVTFTPELAASTIDGSHAGMLVLTTKLNADSKYYATSTVLPSYKITTESNGKTHDITDQFTVTATYSGPPLITQDGNKLSFAETTTDPTSATGTVTYSFELKPGYAGLYAAIENKVVDVKFDVLAPGTKKTLTMSLTESHFKQENVTVEGGVHTIHVYKYGKSDLGTNNNYQYKSPTPSLLADGTALPINGTGTGGNWGDFRFIYNIVEDATYFDDCEYDYFNHRGTLQVAGESTGLTIGEYMYQVAKPGKVKVEVWAVLDKDESYGQTYKNIYTPYQKNGEDVIVKDIYGTECIAYAAPQYFYIDVMKRQPTIQLTPDPNATGMVFVKGDKITMNSRFDITAHMNAGSNGIEGDLIFGGNDGWETDHFAYSFFISDRMNTSLIDLEWKKDDDWATKEGDQFSYVDWFKTGYKEVNKEKIKEGDLIKVGTINVTAPADADFKIVNVTPDNGVIIGEEITINGTKVVVSPGNISKLSFIGKGKTVEIDEYVLIDDTNIGEYLKMEGDDVDEEKSSHAYLDEGDYERGTTYLSMKGFKNEDWTITFKAEGTYNIPYTARPWNHTRWDISDAKTMKFEVKENPLDTEIKLSYYYKVVSPGASTEAPTDKVVVPLWNNYDITKEGGFRDLEAETPYNHFRYTFTGEFTESAGIQTHTATGSTLNTSTGAITIGGTYGQSFTVQVSTNDSGRTTEQKGLYRNPASVTYTIKIVNPAGLAQWEVISGCKTSDPCKVHGTVHGVDENKRFANIDDAAGRMHFLVSSSYSSGPSAGDIYGGTVIEGVPGITMTVGAPEESAEASADWTAIATAVDGTKKCCDHELIPVVVRANATLTFHEDNNVLPKSGTFYKFSPTVNGFLTIDAKIWESHTIVLIDGLSTEEYKIDETLKVADLTPAQRTTLVTAGTTVFDGEGNTGNLLGDYTFNKPLLAGHDYYLYDVNGTSSENLNLHGFSYEPAFVFDRSTTKADYTTINATTFMNGLSSNIPTILAANESRTEVLFSVTDEAESKGVTVSNYLVVDEGKSDLEKHSGVLTPKSMTLLGTDVFKLRVKAVVSSTDESLGDCVEKTTFYNISILDIPTYAIGSDAEKYKEFAPGTKVYTENIKTDIVMTFGGWDEVEDGTDDKYSYNDKVYADIWEYKSKGGPHDRIGSERASNDLEYNRTIDGFEYFTAGKNNPVDEQNKAALQGTTKKVGDETVANNPNNNNVYYYASGRTYETDESHYYNTTYRLPCRGSFLKFEPRESGTLLVYLVQNGSCDYHEGLTDVGTSYQVKWRPLYITDETGLPVEMVNDFSDVGKFLPASDITQTGSYTLGVSRCGPEVPIVEEAWNYDDAGADKVSGCSFDWSLFKGTREGAESDQQKLLHAWAAKGEHQSIIRLANGGFVLPHKAYVRYTFKVKAGKTYFVFQPGSKPEFGGFSFVPTGFPDNCKYTLDSKPDLYKFNASNQEKNVNGDPATSEVTYAEGKQTEADAQSVITDKALTGETTKTGRDIHFTWDNTSTRFTTDKENLVVTINDRRNSEIGSDETIVTRSFVEGDWESICLPFSVSEQELTRVFGEDYVLVTCEGVVSNTDKRLHFVRHGNRYIEAGRPYLIKPTQDVDALSFRNVTIEGNTPVKKWNGSALVNDGSAKMSDKRFDVNVNDGEYTFKGVYMRTTLPENSYIVQGTGSGNGLYRVGAAPAGSTYKIGGYRAFFYPEPESGSSSDSMLAYFVTDLTEKGQNDAGEITGVISIDVDGGISELPANSGVYTVSGQKVGDNPLKFNTAAPGLYIINGKKYIK